MLTNFPLRTANTRCYRERERERDGIETKSLGCTDCTLSAVPSKPAPSICSLPSKLVPITSPRVHTYIAAVKLTRKVQSADFYPPPTTPCIGLTTVSKGSVSVFQHLTYFVICWHINPVGMSYLSLLTYSASR